MRKTTAARIIPFPTAEQRAKAAEILRAAAARNAARVYIAPEVCKHGFPRGDLDGAGCPAGD